MRKRYHDKRAACPLCKPHKRRWDPRWKHRELDAMQRSDQEMRRAFGAEPPPVRPKTVSPLP